MERITKELLQKHNACSAGLEWFEEHFPEGCTIGEAVKSLTEAPSEFVWWFYNNVQQDKRLYTLCGVNRSDGVNCSDGVNRSFGIHNSYGVDNALFMADKPRQCSIFGKAVTEERFNEVWRELQLKLNGWLPSYNNIKSLYLKAGSDWKLTPIANAEKLSVKDAWAGMPKEAVDYVRSLPEYDAEMFAKITGMEE